MLPIRPAPAPEPDPVDLHSRAIANLRYIRDTMECATSFTAVPGWGGVAMGASALVAAALTWRPSSPERWLLTWILDGAFALGVGGWALRRKAHGAGVRVFRGAARRFLLGLSPPLVAAALLTAVLYRAGSTALIPGTWLLLYGSGVTCAGVYSVRAVPILGTLFMACGVGALVTPSSWANAWMALGFGGLHIAFGLLIARRYGG